MRVVLASFSALSCALMLPACGAQSPTRPSLPAVATIGVTNETFRLLLETSAQLTAAQAAMAGGSANIPNGRIVMGTQVNTGYSWHLEDVSFADTAAEVCDGLPSMVERLGTAFGAGRFCPYSARVLSIAPQ